MSSFGQAAGIIVGGVVGFFNPAIGVALGASIGGAIGGAIDPPKGPKTVVGKLSDKNVQTSSYGVEIPDVYSEYKIRGNVVWIKGNQLDEHVETTGGGKGGGGPESEIYTYTMTFAVALCLGPIEGVKSVRVGDNLLFDTASTDMASIISGNNSAAGWKIYYGTDDQMPDPAMSAALGMANCPAYRGIAYIVFYDLDMTPYGNSPMAAQVEVVVIKKATTGTTYQMSAPWSWPQTTAYGLTDDPYETWSASPSIGVSLYEAATMTSVSPTLYGENGAVSFDMNGVWKVTGNGPNRRLIIEGVDYLHFDQESVYRGLLKMRRINGLLFASITEQTTVPDWKHSLIQIGISGDVSFIANELQFEHLEFAFLGDELGSVFIDPDLGSNYIRVRLYDADLQQTAEKTFYSATGVFPHVGGGSSWNPWYYSANYSAWYSSGKVYILTGSTSAITIVICDMVTDEVSEFSLGSSALLDGFSSFRVYPGGIIKAGGTSTGGLTYTYLWSPPLPTATHQTLADVVAARCIKSKRLALSDIDVTDLASDTIRGYLVSGGGSLRESIEPLQRIWPFDVIHDGYKLKFIRRPKSPALTIQESDLGATDGDAAPRLSESIEMDGQLAVKVLVIYPDANREYDINEQYAARQNRTSVNEVTINTPVVLTANEAAGVAEQTLYRGWVERSAFKFTLADVGDFRKLQPADVIVVQAAEAEHEMLIVDIQTLPNGIREVSAVRNSSAVFTPTAVGDTGAFTPSVVPGYLKTSGVILDIPAVDASQNSPSLLAAMRGLSGWRGGTLFMSRDSGGTWIAVADAPANSIATIGYCETALPDANTCAMVDTYGSVRVRMISGAVLAGITRDQLLNWGNMFAIGAAGRWEIVQAQDVASVSADTYDLSRFLRGRFGTEWATGTHEIGDSIVLINTSLAFGGLEPTDFDALLMWKFVSHGQYLDEAQSFTDTCEGVSLECLSPTHVKFHKTTAGDVVVSGIRRTRHDGVWRNYADVPLNEETEKYAGRIYTDSSLSVVKRSFDDLSTCSFTYTQAQQTADFAGTPEVLYTSLHQVSARRGLGYPAYKTIQFGDPYWSSVTALIRCEGANGSTALSDLTGRVWSHLGGDNKITTQDFKFGDSSAGRVVGLGSLSTGWSAPSSAGMELGSGNLTVELWFKNFGGSNQYAFWHGILPSTPDWFVLLSGTSINFAYNSGGTTYYITKGSVDLNSWRHIAWVRNGATDKIYLDGVEVFSQASFGAIRASSGATSYFCGADGTRSFNAYAEEFRVTKGVARYTANFTPPTSPFPGAG